VGRRLRTAVLIIAAAVTAAVVLAAPAGEGDAFPGEVPPPSVTPDEARDQADEILDQPEYRRPEPNIFERGQDWVEERIAGLLDDIISGDSASLIGWIVLLVAVAALVFFLSRLGRTVQGDPRRATSVRVERARTADEWRAEAETHEAEAEWKEALRCRFRALVADLVELDRVDDVPGRTAGEYRVEIRGSLPDAADEFAEATRLFEAAWYGDRATGSRENARFRSLSDAVLARARHRTERREPVGASR
jgi:hypothetical protein